jgi:hypothetical protein
MEGADIYQIAKNCRASVEMIETFYASHIKNTLDAAAINVRKAKPTKKKDASPKPKDLSWDVIQLVDTFFLRVIRASVSQAGY